MPRPGNFSDMWPNFVHMYNDHINSKFALMGFECEFTEKNVCEFCVSLFQMQQSVINPVRVVHNRPEYVPIKFGCTMAEGKEDLFDIIKAMEIDCRLDAYWVEIMIRF